MPDNKQSKTEKWVRSEEQPVNDYCFLGSIVPSLMVLHSFAPLNLSLLLFYIETLGVSPLVKFGLPPK
jgi:hypothetical protein